MKSIWLEVWITLLTWDHVIIVRGFEDRIELYDPEVGSAPIKIFADYEEANVWLTNEEYSIAAGRMTVDLLK